MYVDHGKSVADHDAAQIAAVQIFWSGVPLSTGHEEKTLLVVWPIMLGLGF